MYKPLVIPIDRKEEIEEKAMGLTKRIETTNHKIPYISEDLVIRNVEYFCELAKKRMESLGPNKLQEFLTYLVDEIIFDRDNMEVKILGHIPIIDKMNASSDLSHFPLFLAGETRNKNLKFELEVKV
jgi:hypothetical protein